MLDFRYFANTLAACVIAYASSAHAAESWIAVKDATLEVGAETVLDFSGLFSQGSAGKNGWVQVRRDGHLRFEGDPRPQRFLCASWVPSEPNGGIPGKLEADRLVDQLVRTGYNLVRLHFIDAILMTGRKDDFDYDPVGMDHLQYLLARLKFAGIYWIIDGLTSDNGAYGNVLPHRWVNRHSLKGRLFFDPSAMNHWKRLVATIWGRKNPYTGLAPINDPALLGIILVNEQSLEVYLEGLKQDYPKVLSERFGQWLGARYRDDAELKRSWGSEISRRDRVGQVAELPMKLRGTGKRAEDFAKFVTDQEVALYRNMDEYVRSLGFKGLTSTFNNRPYFFSDVARAAADWVDMHAYQSLPSNFAVPGSKLEQTSIFDDVGEYGRELVSARQWGKPFTVTEYGQPFWNMWRHESAAWIPALAAFQDWDAICQFAELPVILKYGGESAPRRQAIYPFGVGGDPIARAGERLAALLFRRGDVSPSRLRVKLDIDPIQVFTGRNAWGRVPENLSRLALVAASGLSFSTLVTASKSEPEIHLPLTSEPADWSKRVKNTVLGQRKPLDSDPIVELRSAGLLSKANQTDPSKRLFESDTRQTVFNVQDRRLLIATDRTIAFTQRGGAARAGNVEIYDLSSPATVAVGAVDGLTIGQSRRLLVFVLTNAINTGMKFADSGRTALETLGHFPPQIRAVTGRLSIKHRSADELKVWAIDQAGQRIANVPSHAEGGYISFAFDNVLRDHGPVLYFEIADR